MTICLRTCDKYAIYDAGKSTKRAYESPVKYFFVITLYSEY